MKSHLISQVVLKQFANDQRKIVEHTKNSTATEQKAIDCVDYKDIEKPGANIWCARSHDSEP